MQYKYNNMNKYISFYFFNIEKYNLIYFESFKEKTKYKIITLKKLIVNQDIFIGKINNINILNINIFIILFKNIIYLLNKIINSKGTIYFLKTSNIYLNRIIKKTIFYKNLNYNFLFMYLDLKKFPLKLKKRQKKERIIKFPYCPEAFIIFDYYYNFFVINKIKNRFKVPFICFTNILDKSILKNMDYFCLINRNSLINCLIILNMILKFLK